MDRGQIIPYGVTYLELRAGYQSEIPSLPATLRGLEIDYSSNLKRLPKLPASLQVLCASGAILNGITFDAQSQLKVIKLFVDQLQYLRQLPNGLEILNLSCSWQLASVGTLPATLRILSLANTSIKHLPVLPDGLQVLDLSCCERLGFEDLPKSFPKSLQLLNLDSHSAKFTREQVIEIKKRLPKGCFFNYDKRLL